MSSASVKQSVVVSTTPERLYDFVSEAKRATTFIPGLTKIENVRPAEATVGQTWTYEFDWFGFVVSGDSKCIRAERPHLYAFETVTGSPSTWTYGFNPEGKNTRLTLEVQYGIPENLLARYASRGTLEKMNADRAHEIIENIKAMVEG